MSPHIAIVGAGAMGSLYGGKLAAVTPVTLLDPWAEHVSAIQKGNLHINELDGSETVVSIQATTDPADVAAADLAIIFVKSHATGQACQWASRFLKPGGLALTLQNGVGNAEIMAEVLGEDKVLAGGTSHGATLLGPGRVRHAGKGPTHIASRSGIVDQLTQFTQLFEKAGFEVHLTDNLDDLVWGKLVINVGINALTAILRVPNGQLAESDAARSLMAGAVEEAVTICQAKGITLPYEDPFGRVVQVARATATNRSSMLQDVLRGVPTEVGVINEAIVKEGKALGIPTPANQFILTLVRAIEESYPVRV